MLSQIEAPNSPPNSCAKPGPSSTLTKPFPPPFTLRPTEKQNVSIRKSNSSSESSATTKQTTGPTCYPLPSSRTIFEAIQPPDIPHSKSGTASSLNSCPLQF